MKKELFGNSNAPLYVRLYEHFRGLIISGALEDGAKLPSIRRCAQEYELSRTTVENAYAMLAQDGYVLSKPQSAYTVCGAVKKSIKPQESECADEARHARFDFVSSYSDADSFSLAVWSRYVKSALRSTDRLLSYGEEQGEEDLRKSISDYAAKQRGVVCAPSQVVIGAGVQSLLHILCSVIDTKNALFVGPLFSRGETIFKDRGFNTVHIEALPQNIDALADYSPGIIYISPSHISPWGEVLSAQQRRQLIAFAGKNNCLILEDDFDSEFRYYTRPVSSMQGMDSHECVVYFGSFSKLLLPSIHVSFMVLPERLMGQYREKSSLYSQTASKTEQIALCHYISDGRLASQVRKLRKQYIAKADRLCEAAHEAFGGKAKAFAGSAGYLVKLELGYALSAREVERRAAQAGVALKAFDVEGMPVLLLCCSGMPVADFMQAMLVLKTALEA